MKKNNDVHSTDKFRGRTFTHLTFKDMSKQTCAQSHSWSTCYSITGCFPFNHLSYFGQYVPPFILEINWCTTTIKDMPAKFQYFPPRYILVPVGWEFFYSFLLTRISEYRCINSTLRFGDPKQVNSTDNSVLPNHI